MPSLSHAYIHFLLGRHRRNTKEHFRGLGPFFFFFFSLQIDIFLKSRLEIWHGNNVVQKISLLLPFKQITNVLTYSFFYFIFSVSPF